VATLRAVNVSESSGREKLLQSLRGQVAAAAPEHADAVIETLTEAMQVTKRAWGTCGGCGQRVELQMMDATAAVNAAKVLMEQAEGRPGVADGQKGQTFTILRTVIHKEDVHLVEWADLARAGAHEELAQAILQAVTREPMGVGAGSGAPPATINQGA
jgi:hypothetical protein